MRLRKGGPQESIPRGEGDKRYNGDECSLREKCSLNFSDCIDCVDKSNSSTSSDTFIHENRKKEREIKGVGTQNENILYSCPYEDQQPHQH